MNRKTSSALWVPLAFTAFLGAQACSDNTGPIDPGSSSLVCSIPQSQILNGGPGKDGIPALTNPTLARATEGGTAYLRDEDRVVGIMLDSGPLALPLNIFWWHEIVNMDDGNSAMSITHCPLTGSTLAFDRSAVNGAEFGVSGLLFQNNLIMYDRNTGESLWPQMLRGARCGPADGTALAMLPVIEMTWGGWRTLHPDTRVISADTGYGRDYTSYPYGSYDNPNNSSLLFGGRIDNRRPPKERVLGIPQGSGGVAFPYGVLEEIGPVAAVHTDLLGEPHVVLWDGAREAAMAYKPQIDGGNLTFTVVQDRIVDDQSGSVWRVDGMAIEGPMAGKQLEPISEAFVAFWFAWPSFYPDIEIWSTS